MLVAAAHGEALGEASRGASGAVAILQRRSCSFSSRMCPLKGVTVVMLVWQENKSAVKSNHMQMWIDKLQHCIRVRITPARVAIARTEP